MYVGCPPQDLAFLTIWSTTADRVVKSLQDLRLPRDWTTEKRMEKELSPYRNRKYLKFTVITFDVFLKYLGQGLVKKNFFFAQSTSQAPLYLLGIFSTLGRKIIFRGVIRLCVAPLKCCLYLIWQLSSGKVSANAN